MVWNIISQKLKDGEIFYVSLYSSILIFLKIGTTQPTQAIIG